MYVHIVYTYHMGCVYMCVVCCDSGVNMCLCEDKLVVVQQESKDLRCKFLVSVSHNHLISLLF